MRFVPKIGLQARAVGVGGASPSTRMRTPADKQGGGGVRTFGGSATAARAQGRKDGNLRPPPAVDFGKSVVETATAEVQTDDARAETSSTATTMDPPPPGVACRSVAVGPGVQAPPAATVERYVALGVRFRPLFCVFFVCWCIGLNVLSASRQLRSLPPSGVSSLLRAD